MVQGLNSNWEDQVGGGEGGEDLLPAQSGRAGLYYWTHMVKAEALGGEKVKVGRGQADRETGGGQVREVFLGQEEPAVPSCQHQAFFCLEVGPEPVGVRRLFPGSDGLVWALRVRVPGVVHSLSCTAETWVIMLSWEPASRGGGELVKGGAGEGA